jgi:serine/threonine protein kinase
MMFVRLPTRTFSLRFHLVFPAMIGTTISHYTIDEKLGEGGFGVVYKATDTLLRRTVALKFLSSTRGLDENVHKRFIREARAASAINHPNVCTVHAIEQNEGNEFIVMELVEGMNLREWMRLRRRGHKSGRIPLVQIIDIALQIAAGLHAAHEKDIVHRDVKPENIMVRSDEQVKVMDFGLAKLAEESKLTRTGVTMGTISYMSPEQVKGQVLDIRSDIYSYGVMLYELLTGTTPFQAEHRIAMAYAIVNTDPVPLTKHRPDLAPGLVGIVMKCMSREVNDRYPSLSQVVRDLRRYGAQQPTVEAKSVYHLRPMKSLALWGGGAAFAVVAVTVGVILSNGGKSDQGTGMIPPGGATDTAHTNASNSEAAEHAKIDSLGAKPVADPNQQNMMPAAIDTSKRQQPKRGNEAPLVAIAKPIGTHTRLEVKAATDEADLKLELLTNKGNQNPIFKEGDTVIVYVRVNRPCWLRVFYYAADGVKYVLTGPDDRYLDSSRVNRLLMIDSLECSSPFGSEELRAFAKSKRFDPIMVKAVGDGLYVLDEAVGAAEAKTRGIKKLSSPQSVREYQIRITTIEK